MKATSTAPTGLFRMRYAIPLLAILITTFGSATSYAQEPTVDFLGNPLTGAAPLQVGFGAIVTVGGAGTITNYHWDFGDLLTSDSPNNPFVFHTYSTPSAYTVALTVSFSAHIPVTVVKPFYIQVTGTLPAATITVTNLIPEGHCLLPLNDWTPIFAILMKSSDETTNIAYRILESLSWRITDGVQPDPAPYDTARGAEKGLALQDLLEFIFVREDDTKAFGVLTADDLANPILEFAPDGTPLDGNPADIVFTPFYQPLSGLPTRTYNYDWDLTGGGNALNPDFFVSTHEPCNTHPFCTYKDGGQSYILAVRTSATWHNLLTMSCQVRFASAVTEQGIFPVNNQGKPLDSYTPNFYDTTPAILQCASYASSFAAWDITGSYNTQFDASYSGAWNWPSRVYTPLGEYRRRRFDVPGTAFDFVTGEYLDLRRLIPLEQWIPVIGLDLHCTDQSIQGVADLEEVNVVFTDIGADPNGPPGNGGFNPTQAFDTLTKTAVNDANFAVGNDFAFNGVWVWYDTNNNHEFDPPTPAGTGVNLTDHPLFPDPDNFNLDPFHRDPGLPTWEYVPNPPGGGDPWWKIKIRTFGGRRRANGATPTGFLEPISEADFNGAPSSFYNDFFVVVRPDSGYRDISGNPGDGVGMTIGADFRAFIEPRRFNPNYQGTNVNGHEDGGIYVSTMIPAPGIVIDGILVSPFDWQEDPRWGADEPWWPERTMQARNTKPVRSGAEIHDLVINYETNNLFTLETAIEYGSGGSTQGAGSPRDPTAGDVITPVTTNFDSWLDPFGLSSARFQDFHTVGTDRASFITTIGNVLVDDQAFGTFQWPYETVPFFRPEWDLPPFGPRSSFYTAIPPLPSLPTFPTWPATLLPGEYPHEFQWDASDRKARYLKEHIDIQSQPTAMLGINLVGADDPNVNQLSRIKLQQITIAFWGPDFTPSDLQALDPLGISTSSGVSLVEDTDGDGVFGLEASPIDALTVDTAVPVSGLAWRTAAEPIDLDGDGIADDLNGDGVVDSKDNAWVLRLRPATPWEVPVIDAPGGNTGAKSSLLAKSDLRLPVLDKILAPSSRDPKTFVAATPPSKVGTGYWSKTPETVTLTSSGQDPRMSQTKAIGPTGNAGDDLFVVVRTSDTLKRFEQFRILVPSTLPSRISSDRGAGIQMVPQTPISVAIYDKSQPEEGPVAKYYGPERFGYDMIEANIGVKLVDLTGTGQTIIANSSDTAVLGVAASTNRGDAVGTVAQGLTGTGAANSFFVAGAGWTPNAFTGFFLIDRAYEPFAITGNSATTLNLESGTPRNGPFRVVRDPSFLEQMIVELYDTGNDGKFNLLDDLLPLDQDQTKSGVALYRDNEFGTSVGVFDPTDDIPISLDYPPFQIGQAGEPHTQVMFVFSTPGTDNVPQPHGNQPRRRQWLPDKAFDASTKPIFFVVVRTSGDIQAGDDFSVGIVSWGPNTPTEPDPDTFPPPPATRVGEFDLFSEFPWGERALGFITYFKTEPYYKQFPAVDNSGFNWVRSNVNKSIQSRVITGVTQQGQVNDVTITLVVPNQLPKTVPAGGLQLTITGTNFGTSPTASIDGVSLTINTSTNTQIVATIPAGTTIDPDNNNVATLRVTNTLTAKFGLYSAFLIAGGSGVAPVINSVNPNQGNSTVFPVTITGSNFDNPKVFFGSTIMPVQSFSSTQIVVAFPVGGLPVTGFLDVTVQNQTTLLSDTLHNGFKYLNSPGGGGGGFLGGGGKPACFIATAAYGTPFAAHLGAFRSFRDRVLLKTAPGTAAVEMYYTISPAIADVVAKSPALAMCVRIVLTPVAWMIEFPPLTLLLPAAWLLRRRSVRRKRLAA